MILLFDSIRKLSKAIGSRITTAIDGNRRQTSAITKSIAIGSIRLLSVVFALSASAAIETAPNWTESGPPIRFKSRDWADAVLAAASTNSSIAIEGGRLLSSATWDSTKTHLVFNTVYVPSGITLTISEGAVVKFCPGTMIKVEDGGKLNIVGASGNDVILTAANDATVGEIVEGLGEESFAFGGVRLQSSGATFTDNSHLETRGFNYGAFPTVSVRGTEAVRNGGVAYIPFTLSGSSRETAFSIEWEAIEGTAKFGEDYTLASGTISWAKSSEGTKTLQIPLNVANVTGEERTFTVRIKAARGSNIGTRTATVKIVERDALTLEWASDWTESEPLIRFKSRDWADAVLAAASTNSSIAVEGGRLLANTTWDATKTHLVFNTVYVPNGITLTISEGAVVKFCPGTMIKVEDGGKLNIVGASGNDVILTAANDATVGEVIAGLGEESFAFGGIRLQSSGATFTDNGWLETRGFNYGAYPSVKLNDSTAFRSSGLASIPVTISGTRDQTLTIDWVAEDGTAKYGEDYTVASGRITWGKASEGTKTISIPLVTTNIVGATTSFKIKIVTARGANIADGECTVSIREFDILNIESGSAESTPPIRFKSRDWADAVLAAASTNSSIAVEGGRLLANTTWDVTKTHLVFNTVYVPSGITLTISEGAVVKFCPGTMIKVEDGGKLNIVGASGNDVILTAANDATVGEVIAGLGEESFAFGGIRLQSSGATFTDNGWLETRGFSYGAYPNVTLHDATANRKAGMVYLPVTVGGTTRNQSFTVDWVAEDESAQFGRDYATHNSGRLTWSKSGDGTKYITIPLVTTETAGSNRTFKVRFVVARGVNVTDGEATVTIAEFENGGITSMDVVEHAPSEASPEFTIDEGIGIQPIFLNDVERVRYSGKWQTYDKNDAAALRVTVESDNGVKILKETTVTDTGAVDLKLADYPVGCYTLKHEIINDLGETLATMSKIFSVADEEDVELHGGTLTQNEVWAADKVHVVYQTVYVPSIYTLFIEPGAIVKFMTGTGIDISQGGALFANKIIFTHINDDTIGGDTLSDGYTVAPPMDAYTLSGNFTFGDDTELRNITQNTALTGTISTRKILSRGSTYRVSGTVTIANGGSLTIPPGTVLKMESGASIVVNSGATLTAVGTRAAPIIITSIKDDSVSGDTNGDGDKTIPQPGDWNMIKCSGGMINMEHASVLYGGKAGNNGGDVFYLNGGEMVFNESVMAHAFMYGVALENGSWAMTNSVFQDFHTAFRHFAQCDCVNSVFYDMTYLSNNGGQNFKNCIIADFATALCWWTDNCTYQNCMIWNSEDFGPQDSEKTGKNGNIWGDPLFVNPDNGDFRIQEGSPCVDAADSSVAPEFDYYGQPRITVTEQGTNTVGQLADIGICELMPRNVTSDIDFVPQNVRTVTNAVPGELLFVKWEVKNAGGNELEGAWRDTVSLVSSNGREIQLGVKTTSGVIAPGGSIFCSGYFTIPPISEGEWYPKVNVNSYRDVFEGALGVNNALVGDRALTVMAEALDPSVAREGVIGGGTPSVIKLTFGADDENRMVKFDVPAGVKVTWGFGFMPQGASQSGSMTATDGGVMFRVPEGATDVYVVLESDKIATYEMTTESTKMVITGVTPNTLPASGTTTLVITGAGFGEDCEVSLSTATDSVRLQSTAKDASGNLIATVDCSTLTAGATYGVRVESGEKVAELDSVVTVTKAEGKGVLELEYDVPSSVRPGRVFSFTVTYRNIGNTDMCVPLLTVQDSGNDAQSPIQFSLNGERFTGGGFQFVGTDTDGGFGPLRPGDEVTLQLLAKIPVGNNGSTAVSVRANTESDIMAKYTTEVDRYLTPSMKDEFANTTDAELKAYGERLTQVLGANNGEMVQNFAALALKFYEDTEQKIQIIQDIVSLLPEITYNSSATTYKICESSMKKSFFNLQRFASKGLSRTYTTNVKCYDSISGDVILSKNVGEQTDLWVWTGSWSKRLSESDIKLNDGEIAIICHGNCDSKSSGWMGEIASELAKTGKFVYILCVNWEDEVFYPQNDAEKYVEEAAYNIYPVAQFMKNELSKYSWIPENTTFIGHSFGSHLLGLVSGGRGLRHIGLDTAKTVPMLVSDNGRNSVINGSAAKKTEYYRTSPLYGRQDAYADENFIVCETGKFYFSGDNDNKHSYACKWFADNIASSEAKAAGVGFWRAYASNSAIDRCANKSGFMGVINGDNNSYEGIYPYSSPEKAYKIANFKYPGNQDGWQKMYDKWATVADYDITIETPFNKTFKLGVPRSVRLTLKDDCDITTTERIFQKQVLVYFKNGVTGQRYYLTEKRQMDNAFDINIRIPESYVGKGNLTADHSLIFRVSHGNGVLNEYRAYEDLYPDDNECIINNIRFEENDEPVAVINKYGEDDFTIEHKVPFDSYEDYVEAVEDGDTIEFEFDGSKSIGGGDKELTQFIWRNPDVDKVIGAKKTLTQTFFSTITEKYPISLTVANEEMEIDTVSGWLHIIPVDKRTGKKITQPTSYDPNEMSGPLGLGDPNTERFVKPGEWMTYTVYFENMTNATAAAQEVYVTNPLSEWLDWSTFEMGEVSFGNQIDLGLSGKSSGTTEKRMDGTNWIVRTELSIEPDTTATDRNRQQKMCAKWYLRIVDPTTSTGWPIDPVAGFLPPNNPETHCGEGHLTYRIKLRDDAPAGLVITNSATIVFDYNEPITTDPAWWNTVAKTVDVDCDGGLTLDDLVVGLPFGELSNPEPREGYIFEGWYTGKNGTGTCITADTIVTAGMTSLYAHWTQIMHTVIVDGVATNVAYGTELMFTAPESFIDDTCTTQLVYVGTSFYQPTTNEFSIVVTNNIEFTWDILATNYWLNVDQPLHGAITGATNGWYLASTVVDLSTVADVGYSFNKWNGEISGCTELGAVLSVPMNKPRSIGASFVAESYTITYASTKNTENINPISYTIEDEIVFAPLLDVEGWKFTGWQPASILRGSTGDVTVTAQWERIVHSVTVGGVTTNVTYGTEMTFVAPEPRVDETGTTQLVYIGSSFYQSITNEFTVVVTNNIDFIWDILATNYWMNVDQPLHGAITGATNGWYLASTVVDLSAVEDTGYSFNKWNGDISGCTELGAVLSVPMNKPRSIGASFDAEGYTITYSNTKDAENLNPLSYTIEDEIIFEPLSDVDGWKFTGWQPASISRGSIGNVTVIAQWSEIKPELGKDDYRVAGDKLDGTVPEKAASVYDGYLYLDNVVMGTIQAKVAKPKLNKKSSVTTAKTSVTIQITGEKKITLKGELDLDIGEFIATDKKSGRVLILKFGSKGISGSFDKYDIDGARNMFDSKDKSEKATAEEILKPYLGAYSMILDGGILSVTIAKKGKVTIKGAINGNKVSAKAQALIGEKMICIPVVYSKKSVNLAFTIWFPINGGDAVIIGLDNAIIGKAGTLKDGAKFTIDGDIGDFIETEDARTLELLPDNETITVSKSKWLVADGIKPAKVAYKKGEFTITEGKKGAGIVNPSGLKLSYKSKDGSFTGSFTAYAIVKGKLKKHKATVEGILVNGIGYGTITIKKIGAWRVTIE